MVARALNAPLVLQPMNQQLCSWGSCPQTERRSKRLDELGASLRSVFYVMNAPLFEGRRIQTSSADADEQKQQSEQASGTNEEPNTVRQA